MLDQTYIEELRLLCAEDKKEAKEKLIEFASSNYGITLKRVKRSFEFLVTELQESYNKLNDEPMPEQEGLTINDIILADDDANGINLSDEKPKEEAVELIKQVSDFIEPTKHELPETDYQINTINDKTTYEKETISVVTLTEEKTEIDEVKVEQLKEVIETEIKEFKLPENYSPRISLIGPSPGYASIPYWVYDFIVKNENWKNEISTFKVTTDQKILYGLLYYIQKNGCVKIRESRNSQFHILK